MTLAVFAILLSSVTSKTMPKYLINWAVLSGRNFCLAIGFVLTLFSIGGIPPMAGFFSKLGVLFALLSQSYIVTSIVVITFSSIACFYYIRLVKLFYFTSVATGRFWMNKSGMALAYLFSPLVFVLSLLFLRPTLLFELSSLLVISLL
jgi:NADH-quinone oxidoreductase subunit N